ncbi:hypothetical protein [Piscirickettsia litoralis]|uniref:hypothetical protein n=1 Tax=Piscirickettsia litoralis TaxID=1891921 RepID=UPI0013015491|nr:hypothetical protein [Piscirickettsia litoralis]
MNKKIKATGAIRSAARAARMGKSQPAWSDNFLEKFHIESEARKTDKLKAMRYNR